MPFDAGRSDPMEALSVEVAGGVSGTLDHGLAYLLEWIDSPGRIRMKMSPARLAMVILLSGCSGAFAVGSPKGAGRPEANPAGGRVNLVKYSVECSLCDIQYTTGVQRDETTRFEGGNWSKTVGLPEEAGSATLVVVPVTGDGFVRNVRIFVDGRLAIERIDPIARPDRPVVIMASLRRPIR